MRQNINDSVRLVSSWNEDVIALYKEIEEVQKAFNAELVETGQETQKLITEAAIKLGEAKLPPSVETKLKSKKEAALKNIKEKISKLDSSIKGLESETGKIEQKAEEDYKGLAKTNPKLNEEEEALKVKVFEAKKDLDAIEKQLARYDGVAGWFSGDKVRQLRTEFDKALARFAALTKELDAVRISWQKNLTQTKQSDDAGQKRWKEIQLELTRLVSEKKVLEQGQEGMAISQAVAELAKEGAEGLPAEVEKLFSQIATLKDKVEQTTEGIIKTSSIMASLVGINKGLLALLESLKGLAQEQQMHESLPALNLDFPDPVTAFNAVWKDVASKVKDEKKMSETPTAFAQTVEGMMKENLSEAKLTKMFDTVGDAIKKATKDWGPG